MTDTTDATDLKCDDCGANDSRPFQIQTRSKKTPYRRLNLCRACRRNHPKAYRVFGEGTITLPAAGFLTYKRTLNHKNYLLTVHSNGRVHVAGQNVSTNKYGGGYVTPAEARAVVAAVGLTDPRVHVG
jgi:Transcription factor S-II (TFIIS)